MCADILIYLFGNASTWLYTGSQCVLRKLAFLFCSCSYICCCTTLVKLTVIIYLSSLLKNSRSAIWIPTKKFFGERTDLKIKLDCCFWQKVSDYRPFFYFFILWTIRCSFLNKLPSFKCQITVFKIRKLWKERQTLKRSRNLKNSCRLTKGKLQRKARN